MPVSKDQAGRREWRHFGVAIAVSDLPQLRDTTRPDHIDDPQHCVHQQTQVIVTEAYNGARRYWLVDGDGAFEETSLSRAAELGGVTR